MHPASAGHTHGHSHPTAPAGAALAKRDILAIGLSGGLVPCPAAIIMLLMAWQLGQPALGLACLISFSVGLALSLMSVGILAVAGTALVLRWASRGEANTRHQEVIAAVMPIIGGIVLIVCGAIMLQRM